MNKEVCPIGTLAKLDKLKTLLLEWIAYEESESLWHGNPALTAKTKTALAEDE